MKLNGRLKIGWRHSNKSLDKSINICHSTHMKRFALLRLMHNANQVVFDTNAMTKADAIKTFNASLASGQILDADGYLKLGDITLCVAEYFEPFHTI